MTMEYRRLGASGLEVSTICLGTMTFGDRTDATEARRIVDDAHAAGVNFIDTADAYGKGASEKIVGVNMMNSERAQEASAQNWHALLAPSVGAPMYNS